MMTRWKALCTLGVLGIAGLLGGCESAVQFVPNLFSVTVLPPEDGTDVYRVGTDGSVEVRVVIRIGRNISGTADVGYIRAANLPEGVTALHTGVDGLLENETRVATLLLRTSRTPPGTYNIEVLADGDFDLASGGLILDRTEQTSFTLEVF